MSDIQKHMRWLRDAGGRTNMEALRAIEALLARAEKAEAEVERLKGALTQLKMHIGPGYEYATLFQIIDKALEAKP